MEGETYRCQSGQVHERSFVAGLCRLQRELDREIENQTREKHLRPPCGPGCGDCCSRCFCVSETEFALLFGTMVREWPRDGIAAVFAKAEEQWAALNARMPSVAQTLRSPVPLKEMFALNSVTLPFPCLFLDEGDRCRVYAHRPLVCRTYGVAYVGGLFYQKPCGKIPAVFSSPAEFVDLTAYRRRFRRFLFLKCGGQTIVRRPAPLFYYFHLLYAHKNAVPDRLDVDFCRRLSELEESEYIRTLVESGGRT